MAIHDITIPMRTGMVTWPGQPEFSAEPIARISEGRRSNVTRLSFSSHAGTHIDAPSHFLALGQPLEAVALEILVGQARVIDLPNVAEVDAQTLEAADIPDTCQRILFHTRNSRIWEQGDDAFHTDYVGLTPDGAEWIVERGFKLVGADYLGVHRYDSAVPVHHTLLGAGIAVLEGLDLTGIQAGDYQLVALPLKVAGMDGAPIRAILID